MQKYVEIKRDGLTLRGMLHVPDDITKKVPMVIILHGFCDDRNEINFKDCVMLVLRVFALT